MNTKTFIVLDDVEVNRILLRQMLLSVYRYANIIEARSGIECIKLHEELLESFYEIDCIFLDENLPDTSGSEVIKELRRNKYDGPSIMISASSEEKIEDMNRSGLFCHVIRKPLNITSMKSIVEQILQCHKETKTCNKTR